MFLLDDTIIYSATDMAKAASCEFGLLRELDEKLGLIPKAETHEDLLMKRIAQLGNAHEDRELRALIAQLGEYDATTGTGVYQVATQKSMSRAHLQDAHDKTMEALRKGADVVYQATFFDGRLVGFADFLIRGEDGAYAVWDTKLARHVKIPALLQLAAYADQLERAGIPVAPEAHLRLGDQSQTSHPLVDLLPVYRERRAKLEGMVDKHQASGASIEWNDDSYAACGRCERCQVEVEAHRDLLLVAGMSVTGRARLRAAGIKTIDDLVSSDGPVDGVPNRTLGNLRAQAALQVKQSPADGGEAEVVSEIYDETAIRALPKPDEGDIFFDFEGDPMWTDDGARDWGLEYLFGVIEPGDDPAGTFRPFWAHNRAAEKQALLDFLDYDAKRRVTYPDMHIYHYAAYEKTALLRLAGRYGVGEDAVDQLLREGVLVDLYATVRQSVRVSQPSYSIKKLEPLYMGDDLRAGGVTTAGDSIVVYHEFVEATDRGDPGEARRLLNEIADYNEYDCLSTWRLRDWLLEQVGPDKGKAPECVERDPNAAKEKFADIEALVEQFVPHIGELGSRTADQQALAMVAASVGFNRREHKPFWWSYFDRLENPPDEWAETRDFLLAEVGKVSLVKPWSKDSNQRSLRRRLQIIGELAPGSNLKNGSGYCCIYEDVPAGAALEIGAVRWTGGSTSIIEMAFDDGGQDLLLVEELVKKGHDTYDELPMAVNVGGTIGTKPIDDALQEFAERLLDRLPTLPAQSGLDILRRRPPRLTSGSLPQVGESESAYIDVISKAVRALDRSYVAVQGPPGTGKTYVGARVIKDLVERGWRVGVVAQSHAVVENMLNGVISAGLDGSVIAKQNPSGDKSERAWQQIENKQLRAFLAEHDETGCLVGGTAWTFSNGNNIDRGAFDLIVIDEAGQFSLAFTLAVSVAADRLLLLGDPQQLPQVSQGTHPEPVDMSALGWLADGHQTLPKSLGYFLERSWRMHSALCAPVSRLSYEGNLRSQTDTTDARELTGIEPGLHLITVTHRDNSVESIEEAEAIVELVRSLIGTPWRADGSTRPIGTGDILVVAPYNAQVALVRKILGEAGFGEIKVGTVDRFQGQEAPVVIVSMTTSSHGDVPRGMEFLLSRNRINVAISRGQWCAYVVRSETLTDYLPNSPASLAELGAFIGLGDATRG